MEPQLTLIPVSPLVATVLGEDPAIAATLAAVGLVALTAPPEVTTPDEPCGGHWGTCP